MLSISAADEALFTAVGGRATFLRVDVKDSGGTERDLTTYPGENMVLGATWGQTVDQPALNGTIRLKREVELLSLAPLMDTSALNLAFNPAGSPAPLVSVGREVKIYTARLPDGVLPTAGDWKLELHGIIDKVKWGGEVMELLVTDKLQAALRSAFIENERAYGLANPADPDATKGCLIFAPLRTYAVGDLVVPTDDKRNGHFYKVTSITTGITAATEPTWPTGGGATVTSAGVTFTEVGTTIAVDTAATAVETILQQIATDNGSGVTVTTPSSPSWLLSPYLQQRVESWQAMQQLADQIGWDLRPKWDSGTSSFKLKFLAIDRAKTSPDRTFSASDKLEIKDIEIDRANIRTAVGVVFSNSAALDAGGNPIRTPVVRTNPGAITAFGRIFMEIAEASSSQINTEAEAQAMADAALADLSSPTAEKSVDMEFFPFTELGDLYRFSGDALTHSGNLDLAVTGYTHAVDENTAITTLMLRGKPSGGMDRWLAKAAEINPDDTHQLQLMNGAGVTITVEEVIGGGKVNTAKTFAKRALPQGAEVHVSDQSGFTPSSGTMVGSGHQSGTTYPSGYSGGTYYAKTRPFGWNAQRKVLGLPSEQVSFTAGYLEPHHVHPEKFRGQLPPNGSFEGQKRPVGTHPPDRWEMATGAWATDITAGTVKGVDVPHGARLLRFLGTNVATSMRSDYFPVEQLHVFELSGWVYRVSGDNDVELEVEWYKGDKSAISTSTLLIDLGDLTVDVWTFVRKVVTAPAAAAFARFFTQKATAHTDQFLVDDVRLDALGDPFHYVDDSGEPAFDNGWANYDDVNEQKVGFRVEPGHCQLKGQARDGSLGNAAFTLPELLWPPRPVIQPVISNGTLGWVIVQTNGDVEIHGTDNTRVDLSPVRFPLFE